MTAPPALSNEAAMVLGLAGTAMPFARSRAEEAERWLRVLRLHGEVSVPLQAVGVGEAPVMSAQRPAQSPSGEPRVPPRQPGDGEGGAPSSQPAGGEGGGEGAAQGGASGSGTGAAAQRADASHAVVSSVTELASRSAQRRGASAVGTVDVLIGAMDFYGESFDQVLRAYGTDRDEVLERALEGTEPATPAGCA